MRDKPPTLPNAIVAAWDEAARVAMSTGEPWIVLEIDTYLTAEHGYPFPDAVTRRLQRIYDGGSRFHRIAIAHEVDATGHAAKLLTKPTDHGVPLTATEPQSCLGKARRRACQSSSRIDGQGDQEEGARPVERWPVQHESC